MSGHNQRIEQRNPEIQAHKVRHKFEQQNEETQQHTHDQNQTVSFVKVDIRNESLASSNRLEREVNEDDVEDDVGDVLDVFGVLTDHLFLDNLKVIEGVESGYADNENVENYEEEHQHFVVVQNSKV